MQLRVSAIITELIRVFMHEKCDLTIPELNNNWNQRLCMREDDKICHHMLVVDTTSKRVISSCGKNENVYEMYKTIVFHCQICNICDVLVAVVVVVA